MIEIYTDNNILDKIKAEVDKHLPKYEDFTPTEKYRNGFIVEGIISYHMTGDFRMKDGNDKGIDISYAGVNYDVKSIGIPSYIKDGDFTYNINQFKPDKKYIIAHYLDDKNLNTIYIDGLMDGNSILENGKYYAKGDMVVTTNFKYYSTGDMVMIERSKITGEEIMRRILDTIRNAG